MDERISAAARALALRYGTNDPERLLEELGIPVAGTRLPAGIRGFFYRGHGILTVVTDEDLPPDERRQVLAHELGHLVLHPDQNRLFLQENTCAVVGRFEREADLFAGCLLLPPEALQPLLEEGRTLEEIAALSGVSERLVALVCGREDA